MIYSVLDLETTGFSPKRGDKIVEIGIVTIDDHGTVIDQFETLVNPLRDVGPTHIHGITAEMVSHAPHSKEVEDQLLTILSGSVIVGHNIAFDLLFLKAEFPKLSLLCSPTIPALCTMHLCKRLLPHLPNNKLDSLCTYYGIDNQHAHSALSDAKATAIAFLNMLQEPGCPEGIASSDYRLPDFPEGHTSCCGLSREAFYDQKNNVRSPIHQMIASLPKKTGRQINEIAYLELIDKVLLDRLIVEDEVKELQAAARKLHISQDQIITLHVQYFKSLIIQYLADQVISESEKYDLITIKALLALDTYDLDELIGECKIPSEGARQQAYCKKFTGCTVCFTGELELTMNGKRITRAMAESLAERHGMIIQKNVTKSLDYLVIADPHSLSSKAVKARKYGIQIIRDRLFFNTIDSSSAYR
jgi:DNA polymerase III subunit epsilon